MLQRVRAWTTNLIVRHLNLLSFWILFTNWNAWQRCCINPGKAMPCSNPTSSTLQRHILFHEQCTSPPGSFARYQAFGNWLHSSKKWSLNWLSQVVERHSACRRDLQGNCKTKPSSIWKVAKSTWSDTDSRNSLTREQILHHYLK